MSPTMHAFILVCAASAASPVTNPEAAEPPWAVGAAAGIVAFSVASLDAGAVGPVVRLHGSRTIGAPWVAVGLGAEGRYELRRAGIGETWGAPNASFDTEIVVRPGGPRTRLVVGLGAAMDLTYGFGVFVTGGVDVAVGGAGWRVSPRGRWGGGGGGVRTQAEFAVAYAFR